MIKNIFSFLIILSHFSLAQPNVEELKSKLDKLLSDKFFESSLVSVDIYDLAELKTLYQKNNKMLLHPASNMKILTSAAGLLFLGPDYNFQTKVYYTGNILNQTLYGDLYIVGGFDPDFTSDDLDTLINQLSFSGIKEISGDLFGDVSMADSFFWGKGWMWDDDPSTDAPYLSALNINDNAAVVSVEPAKINSPAKISIEPETSYIPFENKTLTVDSTISNNIFIDRDWLNRKNMVVVKGKILEGSEPVKSSINIYKPELYCLNFFKEKLISAGIKFNSEIKTGVLPSYANHLYTLSRPYDSVIVNLNKISDNLSAEMTLLALADKYHDKPAAAVKGLKLIDSMIVLCGLNPFDYRLVDGSGVSHYNLVSTELLLSVLKYFYYQKPELYQKLYYSFPVAGVDGTLRNRMKNSLAEKNVHAKTGTLSGVSCLSGFVTAASGNMIAFSILIQNHVMNTSVAVHFQDEICKLLANFK